MQNKDYQFEVLYNNQVPKRPISSWQSKFGTKVVQRDSKGVAKNVEFNLLLDNSKIDIYLVGNFNDWKKDERYKLIKDEYSIFASIVIDNIKHKDEYKFLIVNGNDTFMIQDPAGVYFNDFGNNIFWDYEDHSTYKQKYDFVDTFERSIKIMQSDLPGLIVHFANKDGVCGRDVDTHGYYKFIAESGVIDEIKRLGFNTIQFLPFAQSIDGSNWKFRYLVPYQFAIQKNWGNPDDFAYMVDMFHKAGIAVIGDFVLGHLPHKDYNIFGQDCSKHGIHHWIKSDGTYLYLKEETTWGTIRIDYDNQFVREFFVDSCLHFMKHYKVDGFRIDNVDGVIRYGPNGDGDERPNGRVFLRELNSSIYDYNPCALINYEAHYYYDDNAKMLVAPLDSSPRALGASAYNSSRLTYYMHTQFMFKPIDKVSLWKFKHISEEKEWGKSNSTVADFHNHDAAAGLMENRCTGAYAYNCMMEGSGSENHIHSIGKIKVMEAIISFTTEGRTLDLLQTFLLQPGTFEHDSSIRWELTFNELNKSLVNYKKGINDVMDDPAFWPINAKNRVYLNVDDQNKIIVVERSSKVSNYVCVINTSSFKHHNYKVGLKEKDNYELVFNSDTFANAGFGLSSYPKEFVNNASSNFEVLDREIQVDLIAPYQVMVFKKR